MLCISQPISILSYITLWIKYESRDKNEWSTYLLSTNDKSMICDNSHIVMLKST